MVMTKWLEKWRTEFENGRTDIHKENRNGGSGTSRKDVKVTCEEKLILESREVTTESLSDTLKLSIGSVRECNSRMSATIKF